MRKLSFYVLATIVTILSSCSQYELPEMQEEENLPEVCCYDIPIDSALSYLEAFLAEENLRTRSATSRKVKSIYPIKYNNIHTRSACQSPTINNVLYIANFEEDSGYAILAADSRIDEKILAVTESGTLSENDVQQSMDRGDQRRQVYEGYPMIGPGYFTTEETGDEIFMNPNTVDLYDATRDEYFTGNYDTNVYEDESEQTDTVRISRSSTPEQIMCALCAEYAINSINNIGDTNGGTIPPSNPDSLGITNPWGNEPTIPGLEGVYVSYSSWNTIMSVDPLLSSYVDWQQSAPFNDFYPKRINWIPFTHGFLRKRRVPAGCFPLAIAKIMTLFRYPSSIEWNETQVNWNQIDTYASCFSETGEKSAAALLRKVADECDSWFFYQGTFTWPWKATGYLNRSGYSSAHSTSYTFERVTSMLDEGAPLIIYGMPDWWHLPNSHAWNIDGYRVRERTVTTKRFHEGEMISSSTTTQHNIMVHCDFGWNGEGNGYYISGIFDLGNSQVEFDYGNPNSNTHYDTYLRLVVYDKPIQ